MVEELRIYNSLTRKKEVFNPINPPYVGMYVCGPTVYNDIHLGNLRTFLSFDIIYRYLTFLGYKVRYVRNITDVGHLESDHDEGEDKIAKKAKLENLEPMEVVQRYVNSFHRVLDKYNALPPSIEPSATGHIIEQIEMVKKLLDNGCAYEVDGSVYFDVKKYNEDHHYGKLSGRVLDELIAADRDLEGQEIKRNKTDFALWKAATPEHIMQWDSPWGRGYPGWHLECSVMSTKYLGETFDIHGGGMDLKFPHHECEIAQSVGSGGAEPVNTWIHTNMLTVNGQKMSKSFGNFILPEELFTGDHDLLEEAYSPMTVRFFILQTHYSSTLDFSNDALRAARKGYKRMINGLRILREMEYVEETAALNEDLAKEINHLCDMCSRSMNDDFNTAQTIANLFNLLKKINSIHNQSLSVAEMGQETFDRMKSTYTSFVQDVLGIEEEDPTQSDSMIEAMLEIYREAKFNKDYDRVDKIRAGLKENGIIVKDMKTGVEWAYEE